MPSYKVIRLRQNLWRTVRDKIEMPEGFLKIVSDRSARVLGRFLLISAGGPEISDRTLDFAPAGGFVICRFGEICGRS